MEVLELAGSFRDVVLDPGIAEQVHRLDLIAQRAAEQVAKRDAEVAPDEIVDGHVERAFRAGVVQQRTRAAGCKLGAIERVLTAHQRREVVRDGGSHAGERVAGHQRSGRSLAPANQTVGGLDAHQQRLRALDALARHDDGLLQR